MAKSFNPIEHYPDRWRELKEIQAICKTDTHNGGTYSELTEFSYGELKTYTCGNLTSDDTAVHTLGHLWGLMEQELNNAFILPYGDKPGLDNYACSRWERMLGIKVSNEASLDDRQFAIYTRLFQMIPYSLENIRNTLVSLLGEDKTTITADVENQTVKVVLTLSSRFKSESIKELMENIVPANMILVVDVDNTTHEDLEKYTHEQLEPYTHEQITITEL